MIFSDYQQEILDDLSITTSDAFFTTAIVKRAINRSLKFIAGLKKWPQTEQAYYKPATAGQSYYNYPTQFKTDSITRLKYNGDKYTKTVWQEFRDFIDDNPTDTDKMFSDYKRQFHIFPTPTVSGANLIEIWGQEIPASMVADADTNDFNGESKVEEAILKYAKGILYKKARGQMYERGITEQTDAIAIANDAFREIMKRQGDYQSKEGVVFKHIEILPTRSQRRRSGRGNFNTII